MKTFGISKALCLLALVLAGLGAHAQTPEHADDLFGQIQALQEQMHIEISGFEKIQNGQKIITHGSLAQQLDQILAAYNHISSRNSKGQIERVTLLNKKQPRVTNRIVLPTRQEGGHLIVSVSLSGDGRLWQTLDMMVDTGADLVVLPDSMIAQLGLSDSNLTRQNMQTANGTAMAKIGVLRELKIAGETLTNVDAAFVADKLLGANHLLGMSVLGRYQVHIDDQSQTITLFKK